MGVVSFASRDFDVLDLVKKNIDNKFEMMQNGHEFYQPIELALADLSMYSNLKNETLDLVSSAKNPTICCYWIERISTRKALVNHDDYRLINFSQLKSAANLN